MQYEIKALDGPIEKFKVVLPFGDHAPEDTGAAWELRNQLRALYPNLKIELFTVETIYSRVFAVA